MQNPFRNSRSLALIGILFILVFGISIQTWLRQKQHHSLNLSDASCARLFTTKHLTKNKDPNFYFPDEGGWPTYLENTKHIEEARKIVTIANAKYKQDYKKPGVAVDVGSGAGRDTIYLLQQGWTVHSIDGEQKAMEILMEKVIAKKLPTPIMQVASFQEMHLPNDVDLMHASYALPFIEPKNFMNVWHKIISHIKEGGQLSVDFFGVRDEWAADENITAISYPQLMCLFKSFEIEYLRKDEADKKTAGDHVKHWHIWHVVAKKGIMER